MGARKVEFSALGGGECWGSGRRNPNHKKVRSSVGVMGFHDLGVALFAGTIVGGS